MAKLRDRILAASIALLVVGAPLTYHRYQLTTHKRLRVVAPGKFYRSGQMTANGFVDAVHALGIRTVLNVQNEIPDPDLRRSFLDGSTKSECELCRELGVHYILLEPDLVLPSTVPPNRPKVIDQFLAILDDPANYPILMHCKAGLHRTGVLVALYRMEYEGWHFSQAMDELKENGFGEMAATSANEYISQYILNYKPRERRPALAAREGP